ncbi:MAG: peptidoglycan-binding protein [Candidatus Ventricola sp.]
MKKTARIALLLAMAVAMTSGLAASALAEGTMLGVQVRDTATPAPTATPLPERGGAQGADDAALLAPITQQERDAAALGERILMRGMEGDDVRLVQRRLRQLGYYLGTVDGIFGLGTRSAVMTFQRAHSLAKVDGKVGEETIGRMFGENVIVKPTPTPTPTPTPRPTPTPTPTPIPTPVPTATPDASQAPFALEEATLYVADAPVTLMLGRDDAGERLYPLCGVMGRLGYTATCVSGSWQLTHLSGESEIALMTDGQNGLCQQAMGSADGVLFLSDEEARVYVYGEEAYVTAALLSRLGLNVLIVNDTPVIH